MVLVYQYVKDPKIAFCLAAGVIASDQTPNPCGLLSWECGRIRTCHALLVGLVLYQLLHPEASASAGIAQPATFEIRTEHLHREQAQQYRGPDASGHL